MADRKSFFGAFALSAATIVKLAVQILVLPILARVLGPSSYGVVGLALPFIMFANMLCDAGMAVALARQPRVSHVLESTIFWFTAVISTAASLLICAVAWPMARLFHEPALGPILASLTLVLVLSSTLSVANSRITRTQRFVLFAVGEVAATLIGAALAIVAALRGFGPWSLVIQQLVFWGAKALWLFPASGFRPALRFDLREAAPHLKFGAHMVGANLGDFGARNLPMVIIAGALGSAAAGHYTLANQLARMPELVLAGPLFLPIFSAVSRAQAEGADLTGLVNRMLRVGLTVLAPLYCGWAVIADLALNVLLGPKWAGSEVLLRILAPASLVTCFYMLLGAVLQGLGRSDVQFRLSGLLAVMIGLGCAAGARMGAPAAVAGLTVASLLIAPFCLGAIARQLGAPLAVLLRGCVEPLVATVIMALALAGLRTRMEGHADWLQLGVLVPAGAAVFAAALLALSRRQVWDDMRALMPAAARA